jgi:hypothetical protein
MKYCYRCAPDSPCILQNGIIYTCSKYHSEGRVSEETIWCRQQGTPQDRKWESKREV